MFAFPQHMYVVCCFLYAFALLKFSAVFPLRKNGWKIFVGKWGFYFHGKKFYININIRILMQHNNIDII